MLHKLHHQRARRRHKRHLHRLHLQELGWHKKWKHWRYKNTTLLAISMFAFFYLATTPLVSQVIRSLGSTGYIGAFIVGMFFVSMFTVAPASIVLFNLADSLHPLEVAVLAGAGAVVGDYLIFRFLKDRLFEELKPLFRRVTTHRLTKLYYTPYFQWLTPIIGAIFIASPGPDEVGIGLLGLSKIKPWQFLLVTFLLNSAGILAIVLFAKAT